MNIAPPLNFGERPSTLTRLLAAPLISRATEQMLARRVRDGTDAPAFLLLSALGACPGHTIAEWSEILKLKPALLLSTARGLKGHVKIVTRGKNVRLYATLAGRREPLRLHNDATAAAHELIVANTRLVFHLATKFLRPGGERDDLISAGIGGLTMAVQRFAPRGTSFASYAAHYIRQAFRVHLATSYATKLPTPVHQLLTRLFRKGFNQDSSIDDIRLETGGSIKTAFALQRLLSGTVSLDQPLGFGDVKYSTLGDTIADDGIVAPATMLEEEERHAELHEVLNTLDARERQIMHARFGLNGESVQTLEQVGAKYSVTRERIRQIEFKSIRLLRTRLQRRRRDEEALAA